MIRSLFPWLSKKDASDVHRIPSSLHSLKKDLFPSSARKVISKLKKKGFRAYIVGGAIRDLLLGITPKDIDIVTDAKPHEITRLFPKSRIIGRRFPIVHVYSHHELLEVATFRAYNPAQTAMSGHFAVDDTFGTVEEDVLRRDFTINALYYDPDKNEILDFTGHGLQDIQVDQTIRLIGDPEVRYREDPVRMLRALRFGAKLAFTIHPDSLKPIAQMGHLLSLVPPARLFEEYIKLFLKGAGHKTFELLEHHNLLKYLFPLTADVLAQQRHYRELLLVALKNTDTRFNTHQYISPGFLIGVFLWHPVQKSWQEHGRLKRSKKTILEILDDVLLVQKKSLTVPKKALFIIYDMYDLQAKLVNLTPTKVKKALKHKKFRAGYDFLCLRALVEPALVPLIDWWQAYIQADSVERHQLLKKLPL